MNKKFLIFSYFLILFYFFVAMISLQKPPEMDSLFYISEGMKYAENMFSEYNSIYVKYIGIIFINFGKNNLFAVKVINYFAFILLFIFSHKLLSLQSKIEGISTKALSKSKLLFNLFFLCYYTLYDISVLGFLRDVYILLLYVIFIYCFMKIYYERKVFYLPLLCLCLFLLSKFRHQFMFSCILGCIVFLCINNKKKKITITIAIAIAIAIAPNLLNDVYFPFFLKINFLRIQEISNNPIYIGNTDMGLKILSIYDPFFLFNRLLLFIYNMAGPFIWQISNISLLFYFLTEGLPMFFILLYIIKNRKFIGKSSFFLIIQSMTWMLMISSYNHNYGTGSRLRILSYFPIIIIFLITKIRKKLLCNDFK